MSAVAPSESMRRPGWIRSQAALGGLASAVVLITPLALLAVPRSDTVALVGRAGSDTDAVVRMVAEAGGSVLNVGGRPDIVIARADSAGFVARLYAAGARLVLDGSTASGCGRADPSRPITRDSHLDFGRSER